MHAKTRRRSRRRDACKLFVAALPMFGASVAAAQPGPPPPPPFPQVPVPPQNPLTEPKRVLGKILFWDEQLSSDNTISCATCHLPRSGGADPRRLGNPGVDGIFQTPDDIFGSPGVVRQDATGNYVAATPFDLRVQSTNRTAQSVINAAFSPLTFWDGRGSSTFVNPETGQVSIPAGGALESQVAGPPVSDVEMAHTARSWTQITAKLQSAAPLALAADLTPDTRAAIVAHPTYPALFEQAFGTPDITGERIAYAIATYERTLISNQTDWDRFVQGDPSALTQQEQAGLQLFQGRSCNVCHTAPLFTNNTFRNLGLRPPGDDPGRQNVTNNPADARRFKVPTLRNAALKSSFMHTGQFTTLAQVLNFYPNGGAQFPQNRDPLMPIPINQPDRAALVAFITGGLVDSRVADGVFPFDQPTLFSQRPNTNLVQQGAGLAGINGQVPQWIAVSPPNLGNTDFKLGVQNARAGAAATLRISRNAPLNGVVAADEVVGPIILASDLGPARGFATAHWPIPNSPAYDRRVYFMQWVVEDAAAAGGFARSQPLRVTIFGSSLRCPADVNGDTVANSADFFDFLGHFFSNDPLADFNQDGAVASQDLFDFLGAFFAGCS